MERDGDTIWPKRSEAKKRRMYARLLYDFEAECRVQGRADPAFVYDEEKDLFLFTDGRFAFSREHADQPHAFRPGHVRPYLDGVAVYDPLDRTGSRCLGKGRSRK